MDWFYVLEYDEVDEGFWEEVVEVRVRYVEVLEGLYEFFISVFLCLFFFCGFLWDEGFYLLFIVDWDIDFVLEVIKSWFNFIDEDGWIGCE